MDPEEDEIFTRKTSGNCECDPNFFEEKKQERGKKKKRWKRKKEGRIESKPLGKISRRGSFWLTRKGLSRLRWIRAHTDRWPIPWE